MVSVNPVRLPSGSGSPMKFRIWPAMTSPWKATRHRGGSNVGALRQHPALHPDRAPGGEVSPDLVAKAGPELARSCAIQPAARVLPLADRGADAVGELLLRRLAAAAARREQRERRGEDDQRSDRSHGPDADGTQGGGTSPGGRPLRGNHVPLWSTSAAAAGPQVTPLGCSGASR